MVRKDFMLAPRRVRDNSLQHNYYEGDETTDLDLSDPISPTQRYDPDIDKKYAITMEETRPISRENLSEWLREELSDTAEELYPTVDGGRQTPLTQNNRTDNYKDAMTMDNRYEKHAYSSDYRDYVNKLT